LGFPRQLRRCAQDRRPSATADYRQGSRFPEDDKLSEDDRKVLAAAVNTLAEDLSTLRGKLGLD
jgi:iron uptake system component EfeO